MRASSNSPSLRGALPVSKGFLCHCKVFPDTNVAIASEARSLSEIIFHTDGWLFFVRPRHKLPANIAFHCQFFVVLPQGGKCIGGISCKAVFDGRSSRSAAEVDSGRYTYSISNIKQPLPLLFVLL